VTHSGILTQPFVDLQKQLRPTTVIEVGAYDADFSRLMAELMPPENIWAFEANPEVWEQYRHGLSFHYLNKAVSDVNGTIPFQVQLDGLLAGNNSIKRRAEDKAYCYLPVESVTLDSMFAEHQNVCLWIDCEGANREVLTGAKQVLANTTSILIEVEEQEYWHDQWLASDVVEYLDSLGFRLQDRDEQYQGQYNCIFVR